jgi:putative membrane protein
MMITVHSATKTRQDALFQQLGITPAPNMSSQMLTAESMRVISILQRLSGMPLAQGHVDSQVAGHQKALDLIDHLLIPSAMTAQLDQELATTCSAVVAHLALARRFRRTRSVWNSGNCRADGRGRRSRPPGD